MIIYVNIGNFTNWFINQVVSIWTQVINILSDIDLIENVSIIEFLIAIILLGIFIPILINTPGKIKVKEKKIK